MGLLRGDLEYTEAAIAGGAVDDGYHVNRPKVFSPTAGGSDKMLRDWGEPREPPNKD